jgi:hypothetical protein
MSLLHDSATGTGLEQNRITHCMAWPAPESAFFMIDLKMPVAHGCVLGCVNWR